MSSSFRSISTRRSASKERYAEYLRRFLDAPTDRGLTATKLSGCFSEVARFSYLKQTLKVADFRTLNHHIPRPSSFRLKLISIDCQPYAVNTRAGGNVKHIAVLSTTKADIGGFFVAG